jgi:hypothetical protein
MNPITRVAKEVFFESMFPIEYKYHGIRRIKGIIVPSLKHRLRNYTVSKMALMVVKK